MAKKRGKHAKRNRKDGTYEQKDYKLQPKESKLFEQYYQGQGIVAEGEWGSFMEALLRPLPCTFRVTAFKSHCKEMLEIVKRDYINNLINKNDEINDDNKDLNNTKDTESKGNKDPNNTKDTESEGSKELNITKDTEGKGNKDGNNDDAKTEEEFSPEPPKCLTWYPGGLAWQLDLHRKMLRVDGRLKRMHQFLVEETESGFISRQEAVSMIPPLLLAVKPGHKVLDMCAAPGSKTAQLIEMLHGGADDDVEGDTTANGGGIVVANDCDNKRCYLMVHQLNRLLSDKYVVVNSDASNMPSFIMGAGGADSSSGDGADSSSSGVGADSSSQNVLFDRVLCDVPCSGDGTLRKNVDAWHRWNPGAAHGLHNLQRRIAKRGVELCGVGGMMVYSTCSFNPVENEAVVAYLLQTFGDCLELVDARERLPGLKTEEGRSSWKVMTKNSEWFSSYEEVPEKLRTQLTPTLFPSPTTPHLALNKCMRILPHHQDTGGFFVALLRKKASVVVAKEGDDDDGVAKEEVVGVGVVVAKEGGDDGVVVAKEGGDDDDGVVAIEAEAAVVAMESDKVGGGGGENKRKAQDDGRRAGGKKVRQFGYKEDPFIFLSQDDPLWTPVRDFYGISSTFPFGQLMVRCEGGKKRTIYYVSDVVKELVQKNEHRFKFINMGVKLLSRSFSKEVDCEFRIVQDGIHILHPFISKRVVMMNRDDIIILLTTENPFIERFSEVTRVSLANLTQGGCVFVYKPQEGQPGPSCDLLLSGWKGKVSCRSFMPRPDRGHYLRLCGVEAGMGDMKKETKEEKGEEDDGDDDDDLKNDGDDDDNIKKTLEDEDENDDKV